VFAWLINHQPAVLFSQDKPATSKQPSVLFSQNKPTPAISHQPSDPTPSPITMKIRGIHIQFPLGPTRLRAGLGQASRVTASPLGQVTAQPPPKSPRRRQRLRQHAHALTEHIPPVSALCSRAPAPAVRLLLAARVEAGAPARGTLPLPQSSSASAPPLWYGCGGGGGAMVRGLAPAAALRGRAAAAAAARWCTCRRVAVAVCLGNLVAALLVARALYAPGTFASATRRKLRFLSSHCWFFWFFRSN
jgi:hypothetical protein